ncbi:hypothetical protein LXA43DRAFT_1035122 [Ganoderma leucocontextum]|nr:hypothetical protein LXA43DRAFT_1035122 [Ganoderma leucocontextum]
MPDDHPIVFEPHGPDINCMNVRVRVTGDEPEDAEVIAVLDWGGVRYTGMAGSDGGRTGPRRSGRTSFLSQGAGGYQEDIHYTRELQLISGHIPA